jgi:hypothetical protein
VFYTKTIVASKNVFGPIGFKLVDDIYIGANVCIRVGICTKINVYKGMMRSMQLLAQDGMGVIRGSSYCSQFPTLISFPKPLKCSHFAWKFGMDSEFSIRLIGSRRLIVPLKRSSPPPIRSTMQGGS